MKIQAMRKLRRKKNTEDEKDGDDEKKDDEDKNSDDEQIEEEKGEEDEHQNEKEDKDSDDERIEEEDVEEDEAADKQSKSNDVTFQFDKFVKMYCSKRIIQCYTIMLKSYKTNTPELNRCVLKLLHRVAVDCCMHGMLFQASVFLVFQKILNDPANTQFAELAQFSKYIVKKFVQVAQKNPNMLIELLFWKNTKEAACIEDGWQD
jgi:timeless